MSNGCARYAITNKLAGFRPIHTAWPVDSEISNVRLRCNTINWRTLLVLYVVLLSIRQLCVSDYLVAMLTTRKPLVLNGP
jgi:hypothetical protein